MKSFFYRRLKEEASKSENNDIYLDSEAGYHVVTDRELATALMEGEILKKNYYVANINGETIYNKAMAEEEFKTQQEIKAKSEIENEIELDAPAP